MKKRILSLVLLFCMMLSLFPVTASEKESDFGVWDGKAANDFADGSGTESDPYIISTPQQLKYFQKEVNSGDDYRGKYIRLDADLRLNLTAEWESWDEDTKPDNIWVPIGTSENPFAGTFDGNGHEIRGVYVNKGGFYNGLFGVCYWTVKNLSVSESYLYGNGYTGGIVGKTYGNVEGCSFDGTIVNQNDYLGGIAGFCVGSVTSCVNNGYLNGDDHVGGVAGYAKYADSCVNTGSIFGDDDVGGIVGLCGKVLTVNPEGSLVTLDADGTITNCENSGKTDGEDKIGGIVGYMKGGTISDCSSSGTSVGDTGTGGIAGYILEGKAQYCSFSGSVVGDDENGGIVGHLETSEVSDCYNTGAITGRDNYTGGIVGQCDDGSSLKCCYSVGYVMGDQKFGGITGDLGGVLSYVSTAEYCYYLSTSVSGGTDIGTRLSASAMKNPEYYAGFNFDTVWQISKKQNDCHPTLNPNRECNHSWGKWTQKATTHARTCALCDVTEKGEHNFTEWLTVVEASESTSGTRVAYCTICGYEKWEEVGLDEEVEITSIANAAKGVELQWKKLVGASKYKVLYAELSNTVLTSSGINLDELTNKLVDVGETEETSTTVTGLTSGTNYVFVVMGYKDGSWTKMGAGKSEVFQYCAMPTVTSLANTSTGVQVKWSTVGGATLYRVYYRLSDADKYTKFGDFKTNSTVVTGLKMSKNYIFTVKAYNGSTWSAHKASTVITYTPTGTQYGDYPQVSKIENAATGVKITWNSVVGAEKFRVYYRLSSATTWTKFKDVTATTCTVTGLTSGQTYRFAVKAYDGSSWGQHKASAEHKYCEMPVISSVANAATGVKLTWNMVDGAATYRVYYKLSGASSYTKFKDCVNTKSVTVTGLTSSGTYIFTVRAYNDSSWSAYKATSTYKYCAMPTISSTTTVATGVKLQWSSVKGATKYRVYTKLSGASSWTKYKDLTNTSATVGGLTSGKTYYFLVKAYNDSTWSAGKSSSAKVYMKQVTITDGVSLKNQTKAVKLTWKTDSAASGYEIRYSQDSDFESAKKVTVSGGSTSTKTITSLTKSVNYYFQVRSYISIAGTKYYSAWSATKTVLTKY